jgi:hypothetical protein
VYSQAEHPKESPATAAVGRPSLVVAKPRAVAVADYTSF